MPSDAPYWRPPTPRGQYGVQLETYGLEARFWITSELPTIRPQASDRAEVDVNCTQPPPLTHPRAARQRARELARTSAFANFQRERKKVEALFAELKNQIGLRRLRLPS
jgi:hypothetical protein